jgi:HNH endonuclease
MPNRRHALPADVRRLVLHESSYKCGNPRCHAILTLDIHHLEKVSDGGSDTADNLIPLCPNCHSLHHAGNIPLESVRAWKMILLALNEGYDKKTLDMLVALGHAPNDCIFVTGDGLLSCSALVAGDLVDVAPWGQKQYSYQLGYQVPQYQLSLNSRGRALIEAWRQGDQQAVVALTSAA